MGVYLMGRESKSKQRKNHPSRIDLSVRNVDCSDTSKIIEEIKELYNNIVHHRNQSIFMKFKNKR